MDEIDKNIEAFEKMRNELEKEHLGKWVLFHDAKLIGLYDTFEAAGEVAGQKFGADPCLIREVGVSSLTLPVSVMVR